MAQSNSYRVAQSKVNIWQRGLQRLIDSGIAKGQFDDESINAHYLKYQEARSELMASVGEGSPEAVYHDKLHERFVNSLSEDYPAILQLPLL